MASEPKSAPEQTHLVEPVETDRLVVNGHCIIYEEQGMRVAMVAGVPVYRYHREDKGAENLFLAQAQEAGYASAGELAAALGLGVRTVQRMRQRFAEEGAKALLPKKGGHKGQRLSATQDAAIRKWHAQGRSGRQMALRLKKSPATVQKALRRLGLPSRPPNRPDQQQSLLLSEPEPEPEPEPDPASQDGPEPKAIVEDGHGVPSRVLPAVTDDRTLDTDPRDRVIDRMLARQGQLNDAAPLFAPGPDVPRLGVLLAVPMLVASGLFEEAQELYGNIGPAFYGLRTSLLTLMLLALLRVKHPENLKEYSPPELGRLLGLDRAPEVKTLRRKLGRLADGQYEALLRRLVKRRVEQRSEALGFLYVDGHVRVYSGKERVPKTHVARMRLSLPATQDVWVNDADGDPLFFVTQQAHPSLVSALPPVLADIRKLVGDRRVTVVFDRGGWSPRLFKRMFEAGFDVLTYRKGHSDPVPDDAFTRHEVPGSEGRQHWELHEQEVIVSSGLAMRQVTRRKGDHQTQVLTTRRDLGAAEVAFRMFARWRQENFFKYMRHEYAIDALVQYGAEPDEPGRDMPNPAWTAADKELRKAKAKLQRLEAHYGAAARENPESKHRTMRGFKIAHGTKIGIPMRRAKAKVDELKSARDALPRRVTVGELANPPHRLPSARKRLSDGLKMLAYQIETDLFRAVAPHYARAGEEGRTLIAAAFQSSGDLERVDGELRITLAPQSSTHRSRAIAELCAILNESRTCFPGTMLPLRFAVRGALDT